MRGVQKRYIVLSAMLTFVAWTLACSYDASQDIHLDFKALTFAPLALLSLLRGV